MGTKTNELQQRLIAQHTEHQAETLTLNEDHKRQLAEVTLQCQTKLEEMQRDLSTAQCNLRLAEEMEKRAHDKVKDTVLPLSKLVINDLKSWAARNHSPVTDFIG